VNAPKVILVITLVVACLPVFCCSLPNLVFYVRHGRWPLGQRGDEQEKLRLGTTAAEVRDQFGEPHDRYETAVGETWVYYPGGFDLSTFKLYFEKGHLTHVWLAG
jgi:hypothetical protein